MADPFGIASFTPERWLWATPDERADAFREFERLQAIDQGRPTCEVRFIDAKSSVRGAYDPEGMIVINSDVLDQASPHAGIEALAHEGRHAYQWDVVQHPEAHPEASENRVRNWTFNFAKYVHPEDGLEEYRNQFIEADANRYAAEAVAQLQSASEYGVSRPVETTRSPEHEAILDSMTGMLPPAPAPPRDQNLSHNLTNEVGLGL